MRVTDGQARVSFAPLSLTAVELSVKPGAGR
jgi:hypothetical protein